MVEKIFAWGSIMKRSIPYKTLYLTSVASTQHREWEGSLWEWEKVSQGEIAYDLSLRALIGIN